MPLIETDAALGRRRFDAWRAQAPFTDGVQFRRRLQAGGFTEAEFLRLLVEPPDQVQQTVKERPAWLASLRHAYAGEDAGSARPIFSGDAGHEQPLTGFLRAVEPLVARGRQHLEATVDRLHRAQAGISLDPERILRILVRHVSERLLLIVSRTLTLELNVARLQGRLAGATPEDRFQSFATQLGQQDTVTALFREYPVLARQVVNGVDQWVATSTELLERLCADAHDLRSCFGKDRELGELVALAATGDRHLGGRAVHVLGFGSGLQVVYKPRSLSVDVHFQELLTSLNERGASPALRTLSVLDRGRYGWMEFVEARPCESADQVQRFYRRQGAYLALLYTLKATDFHYENLIAAGEHPVLIDLESLFQPRILGPSPSAPEQRAAEELAYSVLQVGLLPQPLWGDGESAGIDLSGLGGAPGQVTPFRVAQWDALGTDSMRLVRRPVELPPARNRPSLAGADVDVLDHASEICAGFADMYRLLHQERLPLACEGGALSRFADDEVRAILRPTRTYGLLLTESFHPDLLRDALLRDQHFDLLWTGIEERPFLERVIPAERVDLENADIPFFTGRPASRTVWTSRGHAVPDFFDQTGLDLARQGFQQLGDGDLEKQLWFIRASLTALAMGDGHSGAPRAARRAVEPEADSAVGRQALLTAAEEIGDRLARLALGGEREVSWLGLTPVGGRWRVLPLGVDLYAGLPGLALFFAYLGEVTGQERHAALAQDALAAAQRQIVTVRSRLKSVGAFDGWGGLLFSLGHLGMLWRRPDLVAEAESYVELLPDLIARDEQLDVMGGTAGCLLSLIALSRLSPSARTLAAAVQCGDRLLSTACVMEAGLGWWVRAVPSTRPLAGFAHGASGIAWALLELARVSAEERFRSAALAAMAYERSLFSAEAQNWLDLRDVPRIPALQAKGPQPQQFQTTWCHGAPGIALARGLALRDEEDLQMRAEMQAACETTFKMGFGLGHSLCHGDLGNLDVLLCATDGSGDLSWRARLGPIAGRLIREIAKGEWICGVPMGVETPGLMVGLAGIGYGLLRLIDPAGVPSVLALEPPRPREHTARRAW